MQIQTVTFSEPKEGNAPDERQDGACGGVVGDGTATPHRARFVVLDGATGAYDAVRWVDQLVSSFAPQAGGDPKSEGPRLEPAAMRAWFAEMQDQWAADVRDFDSIIEERKFAEVGSFATLLGFEIHGLDGPEPYWQAVALGDTVLFHVRMGRMIATFPPMGPDDFGTLPDGVHTARASLDRMTERLLTGGGVALLLNSEFTHGDLQHGNIIGEPGRVGEQVIEDGPGGQATQASALAHRDRADLSAIVVTVTPRPGPRSESCSAGSGSPT